MKRQSFLKNFLIRLIVTTFAIFGVAWLLNPHIVVDSFQTALWASLALGLVNTFIRPIVVLLTLPVTILTMGLFFWVINAAILLVVSEMVTEFQVENFWWALLASLLISMVSTFLGQFLRDSEAKRY
jgi:putative membrane protein